MASPEGMPLRSRAQIRAKNLVSGPGPTLQIGNTNSRCRFSIGARGFMNNWSKEGPAHHCAIGVGHIGDKIEKLGALLGVEVRKVC